MSRKIMLAVLVSGLSSFGLSQGSLRAEETSKKADTTTAPAVGIIAPPPAPAPGPVGTAVAPPAAAPAPGFENDALRKQREMNDKLSRLINKLGTPGWREAQYALIKMGRNCVPALIAVLEAPADPSEPYHYEAFNLHGPNQYARQCPLSEIAFDTLNSLVRNHSSYQGPVPGRVQSEWQAFWAANSGSITFGFEAP